MSTTKPCNSGKKNEFPADDGAIVSDHTID